MVRARAAACLRRPATALGLLALGLALAPAAARAQRPHRSGLWAEFNAGPGRMRVACSTCTRVVVANASGGGLRIGGTLSDKVLLGFQAFGVNSEHFQFAANDSVFVADNASVGALVIWFPWRSGLFMQGGVGLSRGEYSVPDSTGAEVVAAQGTGVGLTFGVGIDLPISRKLAITLDATAHITTLGDLVLASGTVDDVIATLYHLGVGLTFR
jgi:hypothetical protein